VSINTGCVAHTRLAVTLAGGGALRSPSCPLQRLWIASQVIAARSPVLDRLS
jgi:hypothetical protein